LARNPKKILLLITKLVVSSVLLYFVLAKTGIELVLSTLKGMSPIAFLSAIFLYLSAQFISTVRWKLLLPGEFRIRKLFSLYMIGSFFNTVLPGIIGGDVVKAYYLTKLITHHSSPVIALASIFMDRYLGFVMLLAICTVAFPFGYSSLQGSQVVWLLPLIVISFIVASFFVFHLGKRIKMLSEFYDYFHIYRNEKGIIGEALLLSLFVQLFGIIAVYILAIGMGEPLAFLACLIFLPLIIVFTMLPISISGIGIREGAFVILFGFTGIRPEVATAISLAWFFSVTAGSLLGLAEYIRFRKEGTRLV